MRICQIYCSDMRHRKLSTCRDGCRLSAESEVLHLQSHKGLLAEQKYIYMQGQKCLPAEQEVSTCRAGCSLPVEPEVSTCRSGCSKPAEPELSTCRARSVYPQSQNCLPAELDAVDLRSQKCLPVELDAVYCKAKRSLLSACGARRCRNGKAGCPYTLTHESGHVERFDELGAGKHSRSEGVFRKVLPQFLLSIVKYTAPYSTGLEPSTTIYVVNENVMQ